MKPTRPAVRRLARPSAVLAATLLVLLGSVLTAAPALADVPENWSDPDPVSVFDALLVFVLIPGALAVVITLLTVAPSMVKGQRQDSENAALTGSGDRPREIER